MKTARLQAGPAAFMALSSCIYVSKSPWQMSGSLFVKHDNESIGFSELTVTIRLILEIRGHILK
jgi:hypothetical protein